jgi:hypothetical protein
LPEGHELFNDGATSLDHIFYEEKSKDKISILKHLMDIGLLDKRNHEEPYPYLIDLKNDSKGTDRNFFRLPLSLLKARFLYSLVEIMQCLWVLIKIHRISKKNKFQGIIDLLKKEKNNRNEYHLPKMRFLKKLENSLNFACLFLSKKTKCLEWSAAYVLMAIKKGWKCNLVVGVQNYPFISHAWVEQGQKVIGDSASLPEHLSKIIYEPFRLQV